MDNDFYAIDVQGNIYENTIPSDTDVLFLDRNLRNLQSHQDCLEYILHYDFLISTRLIALEGSSYIYNITDAYAEELKTRNMYLKLGIRVDDYSIDSLQAMIDVSKDNNVYLLDNSFCIFHQKVFEISKKVLMPKTFPHYDWADEFFVLVRQSNYTKLHHLYIIILFFVLLIASKQVKDVNILNIDRVVSMLHFNKVILSDSCNYNGRADLFNIYMFFLWFNIHANNNKKYIFLTCDKGLKICLDSIKLQVSAAPIINNVSRLHFSTSLICCNNNYYIYRYKQLLHFLNLPIDTRFLTYFKCY